MNPRPLRIPAGVSAKKNILEVLYGVYSSWVQYFPLVCRLGCTACCTQTVTMTSLEGAVIIDFVTSLGREKWLDQKLSQPTFGKTSPAITTNQFAAACLEAREISEEAFGNRNLNPCIFLENGQCSIYQARPFGCRSFYSQVECTSGGTAVITPLHLAVNTAFTQIIEHFDSDGGTWGPLADVLRSLAGHQTDLPIPRILPARQLPGFLLDSDELPVVKQLLHRLHEASGGNETFGDLIDNFLSIE